MGWALNPKSLHLLHFGNFPLSYTKIETTTTPPTSPRAFSPTFDIFYESRPLSRFLFPPPHFFGKRGGGLEGNFALSTLNYFYDSPRTMRRRMHLRLSTVSTDYDDLLHFAIQPYHLFRLGHLTLVQRELLTDTDTDTNKDTDTDTDTDTLRTARGMASPCESYSHLHTHKLSLSLSLSLSHTHTHT